MVQDKEEIIEKRVFISYDQAMEMLPEKDRVHTFRQGGIFFLGADIDKKRLLNQMKKFQDTLELTGPLARSMNHKIALRDDRGALFIETKKEVSS